MYCVRRRWRKKAYFILVLVFAWFLHGAMVPKLVKAGGIQTLGEVNVTETTEDLVGTADSANEGTVTSEQIMERPKLRNGEMYEEVPGLIVTQHSGEGKANQYFLRGFNLDHGTDLKSTIDDMPVNMVTHAHGQGYTDLNFVIPELIQGLQYKKGVYYAADGDFAAAGSINMVFAHSLEQGINDVTYGSYNYRRLLSAASSQLGSGTLLYGAEAVLNDGPWSVPDDFGKFNANLRYSQGNWSTALMGYSAKWTATDQVPVSSIDDGQIQGRFGSMDPYDGGISTRYSLSTNYRDKTGNGETKFNAYWISYFMDLYSDFDYYQLCNVAAFQAFISTRPGVQNAPCDQMEQYDNRQIYGGSYSQSFLGKLGGLDMENTLGTQLRYDDIHVALNRVIEREVWLNSSDDVVKEGSIGIYVQNATTWTDKFRSQIGLRADIFTASDDILIYNQGTFNETQAIFEPKLALIFGPWDKTEFYVNAGRGFHSNDVRGTFNRWDQNPYNDSTVTGSPGGLKEFVSAQELLVPATGAEVGVRTAVIPHLQTEATLWWLDQDSMLIFNGDHGDTAPTGPTRRYGFELANYYVPTKFVTMDADFAFTDARYRTPTNDGVEPYDVAGTEIENAVPIVIAAGITVHHLDGPFGSLRVRYFSSSPLTSDGAFNAPASTTVNLELGYELTKRLKVTADFLNLLNAENWDILYAYPVQTTRIAPGQIPNTTINNYDGKPSEPFEARLSLVYSF